jgi:uncharacterized DUF497 family protein
MGRSGSRILVVIHTYPKALSDDTVRIISARMASKLEIRYFEEGR